ncbi:MAG: sulfurtransferase [Ginsengibacter sp.]
MRRAIFPLINSDELISIHQGENITLIDARTGPEAHTKYMSEHLKGAIFVDLEKQLAEIKPDAANGGRHPLPSPKKFAELIGNLGINTSSHVIVYDDKNGANAAARFWWMLRSIGHKKIQVIDGGYGAAIRAGFPTSSGEEKIVKKEMYKARKWRLPTASLQDVKDVANEKSFIVIDVREKMRYDGVHEPIDLIAGHIPGAINIPYTNNLDDDGLFLSPVRLREKYMTALKETPSQNVIVHCGSGVTACHTILAMDAAWLPPPVLYTGSWSEWSRNNLPIATSFEK